MALVDVLGIWDIQTILVGVIVFLLVAWIMQSRTTRIKYSFPPGPRSYPIVGNLMAFSGNKKLHLTWRKWAEQYGDMVHIKFGSYHCVLINDPKIMKEAFVDKGEHCSDRANFFPMIKVAQIYNGILLRNHGEEHKSLRRTVISSLRDFGVGKASMEDRILDEAMAVMEEMEKTNDGIVNMAALFFRATANLICSIIFGNNMRMMIQNCNASLNTSTKYLGDCGFHNIDGFVPILMPLIPLRNPKFYGAIKAIFALKKFIGKKIEEHKDTFDPNNLRDFIDLYLAGGNIATTSHAEANMFQVIMDLFIAGAETTATTLTWAILFLILNPDKQEKCRDEIQKTFGSRRPTYSEKKHTPYVEGVINETQRMGNTAGLGIWHSIPFDGLEIGGYTLPKNTVIFANQYFMHMDPRNWKYPNKFLPERWINEEEKIIRHDAYVPFGIGPRECVGKSLANEELYLFLTALLQQFRFSMVDPVNPPSAEGVVMSTIKPNPFKVKVDRI